MKKIAYLIVSIFIANNVLAQNPISYPKDTVGLSKTELNFEILWHTFEDNYAFFTLRNINWQDTYKKYRPLVNSKTTNDSLYTYFSRMLAPFQDNHINVIIPNVKQFKSVKPSQYTNEFPTDSLRNAFLQMGEQILTNKGFSPIKYFGPARNGLPLFAYTTSKNSGYLRFNRCFVDGDADNIKDAEVASKILDSVFEHFQNVKSLIIDVRDNIGGNDEFAYEVAGRFTNTKIIGMYKKTRKTGKGYEDFDNPETWYIEPKGKFKFLKPVVVLTNDKTVSAADVFSLIMKEIPNVKLIGSNSRGIYSDMYGFTLPNGWLISLSNQRYYNNKWVCYEATGTPVNIKILNTSKNLEEKMDPVLERAIEELK